MRVFFCHIEKKKKETSTIFQHTNESYWKFERKQSRLKTLIYYGVKTYAFKKLKIYYTEISECQKRRTPKSLILDIIFQCHPTLYLGTNYKHNVTSLWIDIFSKCDCFLGLHLLLHAAWLFSLERGEKVQVNNSSLEGSLLTCIYRKNTETSTRDFSII